MIIKTNYSPEEEIPENAARSRSILKVGNRFVNAMSDVDATMFRGGNCNRFRYQFKELGEGNGFRIQFFPGSLIGNPGDDNYSVELSRSFRDQTPFAVHDKLSKIAQESGFKYDIPGGGRDFGISAWLTEEQISVAIDNFQKIWQEFEDSSK